MENNNIKSSAQYLDFYSDKAAYYSYKKENIASSKLPPVSFYADGVHSSKLKWEKQVGAAVTFTDYPTDGPVKRTVVHHKYLNRETGLLVDVEITEYPLYPIVEYMPAIINTAKVNSPLITDVMPIDGYIINGKKLNIYHNNGGAFKSDEYGLYIDELKHKGKSSVGYSELSGFPTAFQLPNFNIENKEENRGVIAVLSWSGCWKANFNLEFNQKLRLSAGQGRTQYVLLPGERARTPLCVLLFYKGDYQCGQNIWRMWYCNHNVLRAEGVRMRKNLLYCISRDDNGMLNKESENFESIELAVKYGLNKRIDYINQDAGWYDVKPGDGWEYTGNWKADSERYPRGLMPVSKLANENGMLYSVWFEPERSRKGTLMHKALGENAIYAIQDQEGKWQMAKEEQIPEGGHLFTNYSAPGVTDFVIDTVDRAIKENGVNQYRQDENFQEIYIYWEAYDNKMSRELGIDRYGLAEEKFVVGYHRLWETIIARNPGLIIDSCAGGGRRNDLETVRMSFIHTRSDYYWDIKDSQCQSYGMCMWYMLMGNALLKPDDEYDRRSRIVPSLALVMQSEDKLPILNDALDKWENYMSMFYGSFYHLTPYCNDSDGILAMQYEDIDSGRGFIAAYIRKEGSITLYPRGLAADSHYEIYSEDDADGKYVMTGSNFTENGICVSSDKQKAFIYYYNRID